MNLHEENEPKLVCDKPQHLELPGDWWRCVGVEMGMLQDWFEFFWQLKND
jgi:hypothetical protein